jgi:predicted  nucleic acid-binding Zn-ribbon protein
MRRRRDRDARLEARLDQFDRRLEDLEDTVATVLRADRLDDLADRVDDLAMTSTTHDDLLGVRMHAARLAGEVTRLVTELRADHDRVHGALTDHLAGRGKAAS